MSSILGVDAAYFCVMNDGYDLKEWLCHGIYIFLGIEIIFYFILKWQIEMN
jgi:hypothetical protein